MKRSDFVRHTFVFILYAFSLNNPVSQGTWGRNRAIPIQLSTKRAGFRFAL